MRRFVVMTALVLASTRSAAAHAPPEIGRVVWNQPRDHVALVTNRGLIFGDPARHDWRILCSDALGVPASEHADSIAVAYLPDGRLLTASRNGLAASANDGCDWQPIAPFADVYTSALAQPASDRSTLYLGVFAAGRGGLYTTRDAGASWTQLLSVPDTDMVSQIVLAPSLPARIYTSGPVTDARTGQSSYQVTRTSDGGKTWERFWIPLRADESSAVLLAASPLDPSLLLVLARNASPNERPDRMLVSRDGGATFSALLSAMGLLDAGFSVDGTRVWIAGSEALYESDAALSGATQVGPAQLMSCVGSDGGSLYACGHHSGFDPASAGVGLSSDDGVSFQPLMAFTDVKHTVGCGAETSTARVCATQWTDWQLEILVGVGGEPIESVTGSASHASAPVVTPAAASGGGCSLGHLQGRGAVWLNVWFLGLIAIAHRRSRLKPVRG